MPAAISLLLHPLATYAVLLLAVIAALYAAQSRAFAAVFTCLAATLAVLIAFAQAPPSSAGLAWIAVAIALLHAEFLWPSFGVAAALGIGSGAWGSWLLLAALETAARMGAALAGALLLLAAVARTMRLRTLPK
jgi:membrane-bound ClpP family serine protease